MNHVLLMLVSFLPLFGFSQQTEGEILFTETVKLKIDLEGESEEIRKMMPSSQSFVRSLLFTENASLYKDADLAAENSDLEINHEREGMQFKMVVKRPENVFYTDLENGKTTNYKEFFGRFFLIEGNVGQLPWKMTGEQKKVLGYTCQKATLLDGQRHVEAWFTPQIPVPAGPVEYGGLPGIILEVSIDGGEHIMVATRIDLKTLPKDSLEKPSKGKRVTKEEFERIQQEKMKEMEEQMGGQGKGMKVIIKN